ncbi:MAG: 16S rRNA (cytidine(1402)-2'-O)-methyltransferase [Deltaproteobacteria bacterium]|nr:16S rRNA (cytidine(1402)-2'-O)-methyltransferase [Deltaproteobacteria bacterium]MBW1985641.1 16S rRNA (cytidine(1402)-2'-O)-methyltransferase [Deltaproteobacteria bacterium]MBW2134419.1 16S rRNA (cytidine(1402)-2'-O)-methyltransferase [Deltaproteobacteria bacterium]
MRRTPDKPEKINLPKAGELETQGCLYVVATPIGNLEDITLRALKILSAVDLIAAEDTRQTRKLLTHYQIATPLISYQAHNQATRGPELLQRLREGQNIALVSDAGTPGFSDPGAALVAQVSEAGLSAVAIPGPAAGIAALSISGFKGDVSFIGFLPRKGGKRREFLSSLAQEERILIFYESPRRLAATLAELNEIMGDRQILVARELTKYYEQCWRGPIAEVLSQIAGQEIKGECTLVLSRPTGEAPQGHDLVDYLLAAAQDSQDRGRTLASRVARELGLPRRLVYQTYLDLKAQKRLA